MIKLRYDIRCGFKDLYMTEKDCSYNLDSLFDYDFIDGAELGDLMTPEEFYNSMKLDPTGLREFLEDSGTLEIIEESTVEEYAHGYFKDICFADKEKPFVPGYCEIYNLRLEYDPTIAVKYYQGDTCLEPKFVKDGYELTGKQAEEQFSPIGKQKVSDMSTEEKVKTFKKAGLITGRSMKASEVMALLNISRQTLSNYVKRGLVKLDTNYTGKQYRYNVDSVMALVGKTSTITVSLDVDGKSKDEVYSQLKAVKEAMEK